jgi:hypothetical protein
MSGIVYCLVNPAMPDVVKIGKTIDIEQRLRSLDNTSVPLPFLCVMAMEVDDADEAERLLHDVFSDHRVRSSREFFEVSPQHVVAAMRLTGGRDVTPGSDVVEDEESRRALETARKRREAFNFDMVGIRTGTELHFKANADEEPTITAMVHSRNRITFEGEETSLSAAAGMILERRGMASTVAGPQYWHLDGESLAERRRRMELEGGD